MMKIKFYDPDFGNWQVNAEFDIGFDKTKIDIKDPWVLRILEDIDKVVPLAPNVMKLKGKEWYVTYTQLSTGCKALLMMYYEQDFVTDLCCVGDNCIDIIAELSLIKNFTVEYHTRFISFKCRKVHALCLNDGKEYFDGSELHRAVRQDRQDFYELLAKWKKVAELEARKNAGYL